MMLTKSTILSSAEHYEKRLCIKEFSKRVTGRHGGGEMRRPGPGESLLFHKVWEARTWVLEPGMFKMEL